MLSGTQLRGALIYGLYGFVRGAGVWGIIAVARIKRLDAPEWFTQRAATAQALANAYLVGLAAFVFTSVGF